MAKRGRKTKLTQDVQDDICKGIRGGLTYEQAAILGGIHIATFHKWKALGDKATSGVYCDFIDALKKANVEARAVHLQRICMAAFGGQELEEISISEKTEIDPATGEQVIVGRETKTTKKKTLPIWQASAWILERRFPTEFGRHIPPQSSVRRQRPLRRMAGRIERCRGRSGRGLTILGSIKQLDQSILQACTSLHWLPNSPLSISSVHIDPFLFM